MVGAIFAGIILPIGIFITISHPLGWSSVQSRPMSYQFSALAIIILFSWLSVMPAYGLATLLATQVRSKFWLNMLTVLAGGLLGSVLLMWLASFDGFLPGFVIGSGVLLVLFKFMSENYKRLLVFIGICSAALVPIMSAVVSQWPAP